MTAYQNVGAYLSASQVLAAFLIFDAILLAAAGGHLLLGSPSGTLAAILSLGGEESIPAWYAGTKFFIVAVLLCGLAFGISEDGRFNRTLLVAALIFLIMSCDEPAGLHERLSGVLAGKLQAGLDETSLNFGAISQVIVGVLASFIAAAAVYAGYRVLRRCRAGRTAFAAGFLALVVGALGVDLFKQFFPLAGMTRAFGIMAEKVFELPGVSLMIYGLLRALASAPIQIRLGSRLELMSAASRPLQEDGGGVPGRG